MMRKIALCLTIFVLGGVFTGCNEDGKTPVSNDGTVANGDDGTGTAGGGSFKVVDVTAAALLAPSATDPAAKTVAAGANDFAFRLGAELAKDAGGQNFVFSPYSVWMPLAALVNATDTKYRDALLTALGASGVTLDDINKAASRMLYSLTTKPHYGSDPNPGTLKIANAIFVDKNVTLRMDFAQAFMDFYRGSSFNVDFLSPAAVIAVNSWASENTEGLITEVIKGFDPLTVAAIANAIYFSDRWKSEFKPEKTAEGDFHAPAGTARASYMQREGMIQDYYEDERAQAVSLPFAQGGGLCIILPKSGAGSAGELYSSMTNDDFVEIRKNSVLAEGKLLLPRFSIDNSVESLKESLEMLGVSLFEPDPVKGPIANLIEEDTRLWVTSVSQKAVVKVDEKGTTAAAVTVIAMAGNSVPQPQKTIEMICDRPFMFVLYDRTYDGGEQILFTGIVNKP
ncbi:MAG: hypothetical protein LBB74_05480 [Chitinispirillales bacterium]|jgi:serpin B|nr:hypothetical protein [Chitinispirillales bacterium]